MIDGNAGMMSYWSVRQALIVLGCIKVGKVEMSIQQLSFGQVGHSKCSIRKEGGLGEIQQTGSIESVPSLHIRLTTVFSIIYQDSRFSLRMRIWWWGWANPV